uniref:Uncharacterized protein n=1 Tax=Strongyloides stercoralis TaxID=6248 RepID=A0AAF5DIM3_STRER
MGLHSKADPDTVSGDDCSCLVQTIRRQVLKRGREEEIIRKSDKEMGDIEGINEGSLLTIKDMLIERDSSGDSGENLFFNENDDDELDFLFGPVEKNLSITRGQLDTSKRAIDGSLDNSLNSSSKLEMGLSNSNQTPSKNNEFGEKRKKINNTMERGKYYTGDSKEGYFVHNNRYGTIHFMDKIYQKNVSDIGFGIKYYALKEMEMHEYDKIPKIEEAIYGSRPNMYTKFIEENKDMFMNDCSLRCVFDEVGQIRKFPYYSDCNNFK